MNLDYSLFRSEAVRFIRQADIWTGMGARAGEEKTILLLTPPIKILISSPYHTRAMVDSVTG